MINQTYSPRKTNRKQKHRISSFLRHPADKTITPEKIRNYCGSPTSFPGVHQTILTKFQFKLMINYFLLFPSIHLSQQEKILR